MKQSIYRGIAMVAGVLVLVAVGLFFYHNQQQDRVSAAFVRENLVRNIDKNSVNNKYTMTFVKPTTVKVDDQRANDLTFNINFVVPKIGHHFLCLEIKILMMAIILKLRSYPQRTGSYFLIGKRI